MQLENRPERKSTNLNGYLYLSRVLGVSLHDVLCKNPYSTKMVRKSLVCCFGAVRPIAS